eukprot:189645_1
MTFETRLTSSDYIRAESDGEDEKSTTKFDGKQPNKLLTVQQSANIFSKCTFSWLSSLFKTGNDKVIEIDDLHYLPKNSYMAKTLKVFHEHWDPQVQPNKGNTETINIKILNEPLMTQSEDADSDHNNHRKPNDNRLIKALLGAFGRPFLVHAAPFKLVTMARPFINVALISAFLSDAETLDSGKEWFYRGLTYSFLIFVTNMLSEFLSTYGALYCEYTSMNVRSALMGACYEKVLALTDAARQETTSGQIMTMITTDIRKITVTFSFLWYAITGPIQGIIALYLLYRCIGWSIFVALGIQIIIISPIKLYTSRQAQKWEKERMSVRDQRMKMINEVCKAINVIKMYGWIPSFTEQITRVRDNGVRIFKYLQCIYKSMWITWELAPLLLAVVSLSIYTSTGGILTVKKAFVSSMLFYKLREPLQHLPGLVLHLIYAKVSLDRIQKLLSANEMDRRLIEHLNDNTDVALSCLNASFCWDDEGQVMALHDLNVEFKRGRMTMVVGATGSGKSAMLCSLLGFVTKTSGSVFYHGKHVQIGYSSQTPWILNATIKDNILFGKEYEQELYNKVIGICALQDDLEILIGGDLTEIGEKGINLSGGQKQRLSLARAVYSNADVFIFDDPLSAVDSRVANHLFTNCIQNHLLKHNKTVILATHAIHFLKNADHIIVMDQGRVSTTGTLQDLIDQNINLTSFIVHKKNASDDAQNDDDDSDKTQCNNVELKDVSATSDKKKGKLIDDEERNGGRVSFNVYLHYATFAYGPLLFISFLFVALVYMIFENNLRVYWLATWSNSTSKSSTAHGSWWYLGIYVAINCSSILVLVLLIIVELIVRVKAAKYFHALLLHKVLNAPMSFFDTTPVGRIISRFSKDINQIDDSLNESFKDSIRASFAIVTCMVSVVIVIPFLLLPMFPLFTMYYFLQRYYITTSRELKRLRSVLTGPIYSTFSETMSGTKIINSFQRDMDFMKITEDRVDQHQQVQYASFCASKWYGIRLSLISHTLVLFGAILCVATKPSAGYIGIILIMTTHVTGSLNWFVTRITTLEQDIVSVERIDQFTNEAFEQEALEPIQSLESAWPAKGCVEFRDVYMKYRSGLPDVLCGLSFTVHPGQRIGIIGRTGAGKSSLFATMLRLVEIERGNILIGGVDIASVALQTLRSKLCIIPQDAMLFSGDIRFNIDPFNPNQEVLEQFVLKFDGDHHLCKKLDKMGITNVKKLRDYDEEDKRILNDKEIEKVNRMKMYLDEYDNTLLDALKVSHCYALLTKNKNMCDTESILDMKVNENGSNFSVGERQLICLSRAVARKSSILLLDEATSSVDAETDRLIQQTIRDVFVDRTILTIAHRMDTILDYDRILIMDKGCVLEYDTPSNLLAHKNNMFSEIVQHAFGVDADSVQLYFNQSGTM